MSQPQPDVIEQLVLEVRTLRSAVERVERLMGERHEPRVSTVCHVLLSTIFEEIGNRNFTARELIDHAVRLSAPLLRAISEAGATSPKKAGKLFARLRGQNLSGLSIDRVAHESAGIVWTITHNLSVFPEVSNATKHTD
jgi:hypothetical protein